METVALSDIRALVAERLRAAVEASVAWVTDPDSTLKFDRAERAWATFAQVLPVVEAGAAVPVGSLQEEVRALAGAVRALDVRLRAAPVTSTPYSYEHWCPCGHDPGHHGQPDPQGPPLRHCGFPACVCPGFVYEEPPPVRGSTSERLRFVFVTVARLKADADRAGVGGAAQLARSALEELGVAMEQMGIAVPEVQASPSPGTCEHEPDPERRCAHCDELADEPGLAAGGEETTR